MHNIPVDIKAETLLGYLPRNMRKVELRGSHKRNAYEDIAGVCAEEDGLLTVAVGRNGMYDILPEGLFHPIDRFDNLPAYEYKERFKEECERQQLEEENARRYFRPFDNLLLELATAVAGAKTDRAYTGILEDIICDRLPDRYAANRFVMKAKCYIPLCRCIRGNRGLTALMLRHILRDENVVVVERLEHAGFNDSEPRYDCRLDGCAGGDTYLGNEFEEEITVYDVQYWNDGECGAGFLTFVSEMEIFEDFLNDFFMGLETRVRFNISATSLPVRLSDEVFRTYLDYNTNI